MPEFKIDTTVKNPFVSGYIEALFFTNQSDGGDVLEAEEIADKLNRGDGNDSGFYSVTVKRDFTPEDLAPVTWAMLSIECAAFAAMAGTLIPEDRREEAGRDFWYTREGSGSGFEDGDWDTVLEGTGGKTVGDELAKLADKFGTADAYVGDDGRIYCMGAETWEQIIARSQEVADWVAVHWMLWTNARFSGS